MVSLANEDGEEQYNCFSQHLEERNDAIYIWRMQTFMIPPLSGKEFKNYAGCSVSTISDSFP